MERKRDPIKKIELQDGRVRYRFVVDVAPAGSPRDQRTFTLNTLKEARAERSRIITEVNRGTYVRPTKTTVEEFLSGWLEEKKRGVKASTHQNYGDSLRLVRERCGALFLQQLNEKHLELIIDDMRSGKARKIGTPGKPLSARAVNIMLTVLGMALKVAVKRQLVVRNIVDTVTRDRRPARKRRTLEVDQSIAVLRSARDHRLYAAFVLTMFGARRGEVCGLREKADIDFTPRKGGPLGDAPYGTITIRENRLLVAGVEVIDSPKSEESERVLPMPRILSEAVAELVAANKAARALDPQVWAINNPDGRLVVHQDGTPVRVEWYSDEFIRVAASAGVDVILHEGRHTAASLMAHLGVPMVVAAAWLGQSQLSITAHYQKATWGGMVDASKALGDLLAETLPDNVVAFPIAS